MSLPSRGYRVGSKTSNGGEARWASARQLFGANSHRSDNDSRLAHVLRTRRSLAPPVFGRSHTLRPAFEDEGYRLPNCIAAIHD
jgi:hypothetical protein